MSSLIFRDIQLARQRSAQQFEASKERWLAKLVRFEGNLKVPNRPGYVYAQQLPEDDAPPPVPVLCVDTQARENLRVWVEKNYEGDWEVVGWWRGITQQDDYNQQAYLPLHARDHEWPDRNPHVDAVSVYQRALVPLRASPGAAGLTVRIEPYRYLNNGDLTLFAGDLAVDLSGSQPAAGLARYVGVYLDTDTNTIGIVNGATTVDAGPVEPDSPTFPDGVITSAMVRLDGSQTTFSESDFVDLRIFLGAAETGGLAGHVIQDESVGLAQRTNLNFVGAGVTATDDAINDQTDVTIPGGGGWPFNIITVDATDPDADYASLHTAINTEANDTWFHIGRGQFPVTMAVTKDYNVYIGEGWDVDTRLNDYIGYWDDGATVYGFRPASNSQLFRCKIYAEAALADDAIGIVGTASTFYHQCYMYAHATGSGWAYGMTVGTTLYVMGGRVRAVCDGVGTAVGISATAGANVYLMGFPLIEADAGREVIGTGNVYGVWVNAAGELWQCDGVADNRVRRLGWEAGASETLTIDAGGAVIPEKVWNKIDTFGGAASDDLDTITATRKNTGSYIFISPANSARTVVVRHGVGNIWIPGGADISLEDAEYFLGLIYDGTNWCVVGAAGGGALADHTHSAPGDGGAFIDLDGAADALVLSADGNDTISAPINGQIDVEVAAADQIHVSDGKVWPDQDDDVDLGDGTHEFKDIYSDGVIYADQVDLGGNADALVLSADGNDTISAPVNGQVDFEAGGGDRMTLTDAGLAMSAGARVNEFSTDGTFAGDSDTALPTEQAVKTYVDDLSVGLCEGRLTLTSGAPVVTSDQTAKTTVYFTPYKGNRISIYDGASWVVYEFTEKSVAVPATASTPFDVFVYISGGAVTLSTTNWTNDTTRATALTTQDGVYVKNGATDYRYLGTCRTTTVNGQTEDSQLKRFLWNYYHRYTKPMFKGDATSHTYATGAYRSWNNDATIRVAFVIGVAEQTLEILAGALVDQQAGEGQGFVSVGLDRTNASDLYSPVYSSVIGYVGFATTLGILFPAVGYHYLQAVEYGAATSPDFIRVIVLAKLM